MGKKKKMDLEELKQEVTMDEHKIPIQELCSRLSTNIEKDSYKINHSNDQQCLLSRKLKDTDQFEIPKFPSPLKSFPIGG
ncbi:hypothetical protein TNCV_2024811 [Trichonephila clavipes]|nr:hypothetical protein TNCV_2024811 [Trichonephila clavipes]